MLVDLFLEIPQPNNAIFKLLLLSIDGEDNGDVEEEAFVDCDNSSDVYIAAV